jgi:hypothetical protein
LTYDTTTGQHLRTVTLALGTLGAVLLEGTERVWASAGVATVQTASDKLVVLETATGRVLRLIDRPCRLGTPAGALRVVCLEMDPGLRFVDLLTDRTIVDIMDPRVDRHGGICFNRDQFALVSSTDPVVVEVWDFTVGTRGVRYCVQ